jgi:hypothetical protein
MTVQREPENNPFGLSNEYWNRIPERDREMYALIRPLRRNLYAVDNHLSRIEDTLAELERQAVSMGGKFELNPDFQRGHVWSADQQARFVESFIRGLAPCHIRFNCAGFERATVTEGMHHQDFVCVDGLQRLTALREFMGGRLEVFGKYTASDFKGTAFDPNRMTWKMEVFGIATRRELLQFYLDINAGGTIHTSDELDRVRKLKDAAEAAAPKPETGAKMKAAVRKPRSGA